MQTYVVVKSGADPDSAEPIFVSDDPTVVRAVVEAVIALCLSGRANDPRAA